MTQSKIQHAVLVPASDFSLVDVKFDFEQTLPNLQKAVGGYVEMIRLTPAQIALLEEEVYPLVVAKYGVDAKLDLKGAVLLVDEEGRNKDKEVNLAMTEIAGQVIVGDCIVTFLD